MLLSRRSGRCVLCAPRHVSVRLTESGAELCAFPYMPIFATLRVEDLLISFVYEDLICRPMTIAL